MRSPSTLHRGILGSTALLLALGASVQAFKPKDRTEPLDRFVFAKPDTWLTSQLEPETGVALGLARPATSAAYEGLVARSGVAWTFVVDRVTGEMAVMEGGGMPWIPGTGQGNYVTAPDLGLDPLVVAQHGVPVPLVESRARAFIDSYPDLFGARGSDLILMKGASGPVLDYLYYVDFAWRYRGVPVENAHVVFRLNHGNLVQIGQEYVSKAIRDLDTTPALSAQDAWGILWGHLEGQGPLGDDRILEPGRLAIVPVSTAKVVARDLVMPGEGLAYRLVWILSFARYAELGTWEAKVDAHTGEILSFLDVNRYGRAHGGTYPKDRPEPEADRPFARADCGGGVFTDAAGAFPGNNCTSTLSGTYVDIVDNCGSISLTTTTGDLNFGMGSGYDCTTPGFGGNGNTHASRTQFQNVTAIKTKALTYLSVGWLSSSLTDNVNLNQTCNAYWSPVSGTVNFFRSGGGCNNTGELPGISLHEFGHGLDQNDGNGSSPDNGTGETYGDFTAILQTHSSCVGGGFTGANGAGYGDACLSCTGVRDTDYGKHASGSPHFAEDMTSNTCSGCTAYVCATDTYQGPCGYEGHCESAISSEGLWDLANRDLPALGFDSATSWQMVDRYWYASRPTATAAYACPTLTSTNGCGAGSLFRVFRVVDDSDGNLANGTPHASAIFAAFNRHKIGCTTDTNTNNTTCASIGATRLDATPSNNQVILNWSTATNATRYYVYRNELGCDEGFTRIATVNAPTITYTDNLVVNGVTYYYRILPLGTTDPCAGPMSNCDVALPLNCTLPAAPTGVSATAVGNYRIDVTWNAAASASQYRIYRRTAGSGAATLIATVSSSLLSYSDGNVIGGTTYSYTVRTFATCESVNSNEASATAGGTCNLPPSFTGIRTATNAYQAACRIDLTWTAGSSLCSGTISYNVYRSATAGFTPGPSYLIASGLSGTTYQDSAVAFQKTYYYAVRAVDSLNGLDDGNGVVLSVSPTGPLATIYTNDFELNMTGWTTGPDTATTGTFVRGDPVGTTDNGGRPCQPENAHGGVNVLYTATNPTGNAGVDDVDNGEVRLTSPTFNGTGYPSVLLDMWRWWVNEDTDAEQADYYYLEVSNDGGSSWTTLEYLPDTISSSGGSGNNSWKNIKLALESFVGLTSNMRIRFRCADEATTGDLVEYALDDFAIRGVTSCTNCTPPAVPAGLTATASAANAITLSWSGSAPRYAIYRSNGACPGGTFVQIAGNVTATTFVDTSVSGGSTYSYKVSAMSASYCESALSTCAGATATGSCLLPPSFAGIGGVTNSHSATCGITLSWTAATPACSGAITYSIYRSTTSPFTPDVNSRIATGVTGTSYTDATGLVYGTIYSYIVHAVENGREETNTVTKSDGPSGGVITGAQLYFRDFETGSGTTGWGLLDFTTTLNGTADVRGIMTCTAQSGIKIFKWGGAGGFDPCTANYANNRASGAEPLPNLFGLDIPFDATNLKLDFWHRWNFATGDGALFLMKRSTQRVYYYFDTSIITAGQGYNGTTAANNPIPNAACWTGTFGSFVSTTIDLDKVCTNIGGTPCRGSTIEMVFTGASNPTGNDDGWFFDDYRVTADYGTSCTSVGCGMLVEVTPASATVGVGADILLSVAHTSGKPPYAYQWTENGVDIPGAINSQWAVNKAAPGTFTYNCKVTDSSGVCANMVDGTPATGTWIGGPPPVGDGGTAGGSAATFTKSGNDVIATWDNGTCQGTNSIVLYNSIGTFTGYAGSVACNAGTDGTETFTPPAGSVWFNILWTNGTTAGHPGYGSSGARTWTAAGLCAMTADNSTDGTCN